MKTDYRKICDPADSGFRLAHSPFYLIAHTDLAYHEDMSAVLEKRGVNKNMYRIMTVLRVDEPAAITRLADRALIKRSTVSRIVDRMTDIGLTRTSTNETDNRVTVVELTRAGSEMLDTLTPVMANQFRRAMSGLSSDEISTLVGLLQRIGDNLTEPK